MILNDETGIPDENLYNAILNAADSNKDGVLTISEAEALEKLNAENNNITDLTGIAYCKMLQEIDLSDNSIEDVTPLASLTNLKKLDLSNNRISSISALSVLTECEIITDGNDMNEPSTGTGPIAPENPSDDEPSTDEPDTNKPNTDSKPDADTPSTNEPDTGTSTSKPIYNADNFKELLEKQDIVIKPNDYVTITFTKGSQLNDTTGKTEYNFTTTVTTDYTNAKLPTFITQNSFITKISYTYSGVLPTTANIEISIGKDYAGKDVFYFLLNENGTFDKDEVQQVKVNENGMITVKQEHCSDYVVTTVNPEDLYEAAQNSNEGTDDVESPKTGDNAQVGILWSMVIVSGIMAVIAYKRKQA